MASRTSVVTRGFRFPRALVVTTGYLIPIGPPSFVTPVGAALGLRQRLPSTYKTPRPRPVLVREPVRLTADGELPVLIASGQLHFENPVLIQDDTAARAREATIRHARMLRDEEEELIQIGVL